jgi:hypothetical protein
VLVLRGGDPLSDNAAIQALQERGLTVVSGPLAPDFDGSKDELRDIDVVLLLYTANSAFPLNANGVTALTSFVEKGGGLVTAGWAVWLSGLAPILPALYCEKNLALTTTYRRAAPNPAVNLDLPLSFELNLANLAGSEACLDPREGATVLFSSSNGGGRAERAGLLAWNANKGRVASFSTLLSAVELLSPAYRTLFQNTVEWLAVTRDTSPPQIRSFSVSGAGGLVAERTVSLSLSANDSGGSRLASYYIREFRFSGDPANGWVEAAASGWQPLAPPGLSRSWTLDPTPGVHYLQAFVADNAGNVSPAPGIALVNYAPAEVPIAQDQIHIYRVTPAIGSSNTVTMQATAGNPDLYVFGPNVSFSGEVDDLVTTSPNFIAQAGVYQIEVEGYTAGAYNLSLATTTGRGNGGAGDAHLDGRPRIRVLSITPPEPSPEPGELPGAPVDPGAAAMFEALYLPILR